MVRIVSRPPIIVRARNSPFMMRNMASPGFALPDHLGVLRPFLKFQKVREVRQLSVLHFGEDFYPAQRTRFEIDR